MDTICGRKYVYGILIFYAVIFNIFLFYYTNPKKNNGTKDITNENQKEIKIIDISGCDARLAQWIPRIPVLLIDLDFLKSMKKLDCNWNETIPIKVGINQKHKSGNLFLDDQRFEKIYYSNNVSKDFLEFNVDGRRLIPKRFNSRKIGNIKIPTNVKQFAEFWKRSKFVDCAGIKVQRNDSEPLRMPGQSSSDLLARLRDELIDNDMFPFLNSGTFLGWYRECSMIPHTSDLDVAVYYNNYNPEYLKKLERGESQFKILRRLGMDNDSLELTVIPKSEGGPKMDIFVMYDEIENGTVTHSYISGLGEDGTKYKFSYPIYDPWCAAELHGHMFWVSCTPLSKIIFEYGELWHLDNPSSKYSWNKATNNVKPNGKLTRSQMKESFIAYGWSYYWNLFRFTFLTF